MLRQFIMIFSIAILLTSCGAKTDAAETTSKSEQSGTQATSNEPTNPSESTQSETPETTTENTTSENTTTEAPAQVVESYVIKDQTVILEALNTALTLPEIDGLSNGSLQENVNAIIAEGANEITRTLDGTNPVTINYEVISATPKLLSIVFKAEMEVESGTIIFWNPINIHIPTASKISVDNLFNHDNVAISKFNLAFSDAASGQGYDFEKPEDWMIFTLDQNNIVFLFKESDLSEDYTEISIPFSTLAPAMNSLFLN